MHDWSSSLSYSIYIIINYLFVFFYHQAVHFKISKNPISESHIFFLMSSSFFYSKESNNRIVIHQKYIVGYILGLAIRGNIRGLNRFACDELFLIHRDVAWLPWGYYAGWVALNQTTHAWYMKCLEDLSEIF